MKYSVYSHGRTKGRIFPLIWRQKYAVFCLEICTV